MRFSLFTPTHNPKYLARLQESIRAQDFTDFEWLILPNGNASLRDVTDALGLPNTTPVPGTTILARVPEGTTSVGALKRACCDQARGEILVEVDHDDELAPDCLSSLDAAFKEGSVLTPPSDTCDFVYSNCIEVGSKPYDPIWGWQIRHARYHGEQVHETLSFPPSPAAFSRIWFAPNHVRAWRRQFYKQIGGHDPALDVCDDLDLLARTYLQGTVRHVPRALYIYHAHGENTVVTRNARIQEVNGQLYMKYIYALVEHWAKSNRLLAVDLCCHKSPAPGYVGVDLDPPHGHLIADLNGTWPFPDGSVGVFRAHDALEHLRDPIHTMKEIQRCLTPGGWLLSLTPSTDGRGAFQDPTHVSFWNENSFWYYTRQEQAQFIGTPVRFQSVWASTFFPTEWHKAHNIAYVQAQLLKLDGLNERPPGLIEI